MLSANDKENRLSILRYLNLAKNLKKNNAGISIPQE
jgi:hypothetical protein